MSDLVTVGTFFDRIGAELAQSVLSAESIESYVSADDAGGMRPALLTATGGARLIVRTEDAERVTELLEVGTEVEADAEDETPVS